MTSPYTDQSRPIARALKFGTWGLIIITIVSLAVWGSIQGMPGIWGVLLGAGIGGGFVLLTALSVRITSTTDPVSTAAVVLGGWLLKIVVLILVLAVIRDMTFYHHMALLVTVVVALITVLATEVWGIVTTNVTFVGK
ncbi:hypothetical protein [Corynebacterium tapiri]|uniref:hypothetical protein n=1 Tax=Corynebacterium tapiri TaxID=1448266 RepID=UPI0015D591E7|nr:hypothetical protein [Corynebacterium tapiri]